MVFEVGDGNQEWFLLSFRPFKSYVEEGQGAVVSVGVLSEADVTRGGKARWRKIADRLRQ